MKFAMHFPLHLCLVAYVHSLRLVLCHSHCRPFLAATGIGLLMNWNAPHSSDLSERGRIQVEMAHSQLCRSLAACEQLSRAGYQEIAWINGGFDTARKEDLPVVGAPDL